MAGGNPNGKYTRPKSGRGINTLSVAIRVSSSAENQTIESSGMHNSPPWRHAFITDSTVVHNSE
ncbi:unnamed protein product, partial [Ectocarpus sp. 8 AP-2014]